MKKIFLTVLVVMATSFFGASAFAGSSSVDCPLKNLKKNMLRDAKTAFVPSSMSSNKTEEAANVGRNR